MSGKGTIFMNNYNELEQELKELIEQNISIGIKDIIKLKGDASYRSYYRILGNKPSETVILMKWDPKLTNKSEEASKNISTDEFPFVNICNYLMLFQNRNVTLSAK